MIRLGVNIDHVATLREARGENYPSLIDAARTSLQAGADQITIHLREDRRHIQDTDVPSINLVVKEFGKPLNLEMGCDPQIIDLAISSRPDWICLVPEKREEKTTEGGLDLINPLNFQKIAQSMDQLRQGINDVKISLFLEANIEILKRAVELRPNAVEIHTGDFARAFVNSNRLDSFYDEFAKAREFLEKYQIACHAGHGLTLDSTKALLEKGYFTEYNIGHWIVCQSLFDGLGSVVQKLKSEFKKVEKK